MSFVLPLDRSLADAVRETWGAQLRQTERRFRKTGDFDVAVHGARKACKRLRALIRLIAPGLKAKVAKTENRRFRDIGRSLAAARDRAVLSATIDSVAHTSGLTNDPAVTQLRQLLAARDNDAASAISVPVPLDASGPDPSAVRSAINEAKAALGDIDFDGLRDRHVIAGFLQAYREARKGLRAARQTSDDEVVHDWRKAVQAHWRHCALLSAIWPDEMAVRVETARAISQSIGFDHDLSVFIAVCEAFAGHGMKRADAKRLIAAARTMQAAARAEGLEDGERLFALPPSAMRKLVGRWLAVARQSPMGQTATSDLLVKGRESAEIVDQRKAAINQS